MIFLPDKKSFPHDIKKLFQIILPSKFLVSYTSYVLKNDTDF
jgi:hypothetical protein